MKAPLGRADCNEGSAWGLLQHVVLQWTHVSPASGMCLMEGTAYIAYLRGEGLRVPRQHSAADDRYLCYDTVGDTGEKSSAVRYSNAAWSIQPTKATN